MDNVGIDKLGIYVPGKFVCLEELAKARGIDPNKFIKGLGQESFAVTSSNEDTVTMAANALDDLLENSDLEVEEIGRLVVATETPVDQSKPIGNYLRDLFKLPKTCVTYEIKHSCIAGTYALFNSIDWIRFGQNLGKKAVVICTDIAKYKLGTPAEPTQGAGAVALLISENPRLISLDSITGDVNKYVMDFWKPLSSDVAKLNGKSSVEYYLEGLKDSFEDYRLKEGNTDFDHLVFHTPYTKLVKKAFMELSKGLPHIEGRFEEMTSHSLSFGRRVGNIYTGSLYLALASLLNHEQERAVNKTIGFYSFGSGYSARFFRGTVEGRIRDLDLNHRKKISIETYEKLRLGAISIKETEGIVLEHVDGEEYRHYCRKLK